MCPPTVWPILVLLYFVFAVKIRMEGLVPKKNFGSRNIFEAALTVAMVRFYRIS